VVFLSRVRSSEEVSGFADDSVKSHILRWTCYWRKVTTDKELPSG